MADTNEIETPGNSAETAHEGGTESVVTARDRFQREMQSRYERVSEDVRRGAERASQEIRRGSDVARERYSEVAANARVGYDKVRSNAGELSTEVTHYVRDNPGRSVLIAAGVGFLVGLLARRGAGREEL